MDDSKKSKIAYEMMWDILKILDRYQRKVDNNPIFCELMLHTIKHITIEFVTSGFRPETQEDVLQHLIKDINSRFNAFNNSISLGEKQ